MKLNVKGEDEAKKDYKVNLKKFMFIIFEYVPMYFIWFVSKVIFFGQCSDQ